MTTSWEKFVVAEIETFDFFIRQNVNSINNGLNMQSNVLLIFSETNRNNIYKFVVYKSRKLWN